MAEATKIEVITGPAGDAEIYELYEANQPLQYNIHFKGKESAVFMTLGEACVASIPLREDGTPPPGSENPELYKVRSCAVVLSGGEDWMEALGDWFYARTDEYPAAAGVQTGG